MRRLASGCLLVTLTLTACTSEDAEPERPEASVSSEPPSSPPSEDEPSRETFGAASLRDPYVGSFGNGGYDALRYDLDLRWQPGQERLSGVATMTARADQDLSRFNLDLVGLKVARATVDGRPARVKREGTELEITPQSMIRDQQRFTTEIRYAGTPRESGVMATGSDLPSGWRTLEDSAFVWGEPISASTTYPVNDHPSDKAAYRFTITAPSDQTVAANGVMTSRRRSKDLTTWTFLQPQPMASYLTTVLIGDFRLFGGGYSRSGVPIRNYADTAVLSQARDLFAEQAKMIDAFEPLFGGYPFDAYGSAMVDDDFPAALENQTLSVYSPSVAGAGERVVAHELAHQWFGDSVSLESWGDIWLNEGFATYAEALWGEAAHPEFTYPGWIRSMLATGADLEQRIVDPSGDLFAPAVYLRGGMTLHALRLKVGDKDFFRILRSWHRRHAGGNATTEDFEELAASVSGARLDAFFDSWLRTKALPAQLDGVPLR